jgi:hypothetical protein
MLENAFKAYNNIIPGHPVSVRMGWDFHNNATLNKLANLGIKIDFSSLPGLRTKMPSRDARPYNIFDWINSPRTPYMPSKTDYRRGVKEDERAMAITELPIFTSRSFLWGMVSGLQFARKMKDPTQLIQALLRPTFLINITGKPKLFSPILSEIKIILQKTDDSVFFATYFHADELLDNKSSLYSRHNMKANIGAILKVGADAGIPVKFIKANEVPGLIN